MTSWSSSPQRRHAPSRARVHPNNGADLHARGGVEVGDSPARDPVRSGVQLAAICAVGNGERHKGTGSGSSGHRQRSFGRGRARSMTTWTPGSGSPKQSDLEPSWRLRGLYVAFPALRRDPDRGLHSKRRRQTSTTLTAAWMDLETTRIAHPALAPRGSRTRKRCAIVDAPDNPLGLIAWFQSVKSCLSCGVWTADTLTDVTAPVTLRIGSAPSDEPDTLNRPPRRVEHRGRSVRLRLRDREAAACAAPSTETWTPERFGDADVPDLPLRNRLSRA